MAGNGIVLEVLSKENYENWSALVRNHLKGRDLWDVVTSNPDGKRRGWTKKNAQALHAIQLSCGSDNLTSIRDIERAQDAWNRLQALFGPNSRAQRDIELGTHSSRTVLHSAVIAGNEDEVKELVDSAEEDILVKRDDDGYTALALVADLTGNIKIAKRLVEKSRGFKANNPNHIAIQMIPINDNNQYHIPLLLAATKGHKELTRYLFEQTPLDELCRGGSFGALLLTRCIANEIFDVALSLLHHFEEVPLSHEFHDPMPLYALANKPSAFQSGSRLGPLQKLVYKSLQDIPIEIIPNGDRNDRQVQVNTGGVLKRAFVAFRDKIFAGFKKASDEKKTHLQVLDILRRLSEKVRRPGEALENAAAYDAMLEAARNGIIEFINAMREAHPDLFWVVDGNNRGIFSHAVLNRRQNVFQLIQELDGRRELITSRPDAFGNNMLHLAGLLGPSTDLGSISCAALQMQREIQWFKAMKKIAHPKCKEMPNSEGKKPHEVFTKSHEELVKAGEKWAKDMATSFTLVATLIVTIMFAAAFTVPGGLNQDTGIPIFLHSNKPEVKQYKLFKLFIISDAVSLFTSSAAVLIFIGILTSRYSEKDFLRALPRKMLFGLLLLSVSVAAMITAFCGALGLMLKGHTYVFIVALSFACIPILGFLRSQLPIFFEILKSTIRSNVFYLRKEM